MEIENIGLKIKKQKLKILREQNKLLDLQILQLENKQKGDVK